MKNNQLITSFFMLSTYLLFSFVLPIEAQATFTQSPTASLQNGKINISFAVSVSTDVEVAILDAQDRIVRHLAAGVLGGQYPPPAPLASGLSQSLDWDGFDDYYQSATGGPFKVRVRLGIKPAFEKSISTKVFPNTGYEYYDGTVRGVTYTTGPVDPAGDIIDNRHPALVRAFMHVPCKLDMAVSDITDEIFIKIFNSSSNAEARINAVTGELIKLFGLTPKFSREQWGEPVLSWDGQYIYHSSGLDTIYRFGIDGRSAPWPGSSTYKIGGLPQGWQHSRGHAAGPDGSVYVLHHVVHRGVLDHAEAVRVSQIDQNGNIARLGFIQIDAPGSGVKVDMNGNVFVGARVKPLNMPWPEDLNSVLGSPAAKALKVNSPPASFDIRPIQYWAEEGYASLLKFGPSGGKIMRGQTGDVFLGSISGASGTMGTQEGLIWMYYGYSHVTRTYGGKETTDYGGCHCVCNTVRFDIDRFGRVFLPDGLRSSIVVLDNNKNEILRFANRDVPGVAIGYPHQLEVTDRALYVADQFNNQVVVFTFGAAQEAVVDLPVYIEEGTQLAFNGMRLEVHPNPFNLITTLSINVGDIRADGDSPLMVTVYDTKGRVVKTLEYSVSEMHPVKSFMWNAENLAPGVYIAKASMGKKIVSKKIFIYK